jgi:signal transduction histidine kinase
VSSIQEGSAASGEGLRIDPVRAECIRTLFQQIPNSFAAAGVVTIYMCATAAPFHSRRAIAVWLAVQLSTQVFRLWLVARYRRIPAGDDGVRLEAAARLNTLYMLIAGLVWGSTAFVFMDVAQPITVALTLCGLYGISGGSVPGNAYNPIGLFAFIGAIFGLVMLRMLTIGEYAYNVLGLASIGYSGILVMFCRVQNRELKDGFAIRFENRRLLAALEVEKAEADAARARAEKANLAKSQLLAAASHDLRQPLHALSLFSGSLQSLALDDEAKDVAQRIQANVAAMEKLFNGLLDISRLEAGVVQSHREPVSCQDLFDRLAGYFDPVAEQQGLDLRFRETDLWIDSDAALAEQICVNLVTNALRYTRTGGIWWRRAGAATGFPSRWPTPASASRGPTRRGSSTSSCRSEIPSATGARAWGWAWPSRSGWRRSWRAASRSARWKGAGRGSASRCRPPSPPRSPRPWRRRT